MAQGKGLKKTVIASKPKKAAAAGAAAGTMRKGRVVKASKKQGVARQNKLTKKLTASVTSNLEQAMAVKAGAVGKLTILKDAQKKGQTTDVKRRKR
ncbi:hypothetical protein IWQ56_000075 [Coemansia nantahalensis]|uniref:Uncharacterized protein n=2 Tax=Coemansia TaxID=4863 RepID=A0ACC1L9D4_9FUNG|nr:hypothetical protein IWQ57_001601 [Coemansia nantahalensis]KAJ2775372.1 hypothetical protein IWQ56_000075 [Coemansia nantahalensis]KAJ2803100.1 hypothetical protein H4R21_002164 [Coemansia helicoidea]